MLKIAANLFKRLDLDDVDSTNAQSLNFNWFRAHSVRFPDSQPLGNKFFPAAVRPKPAKHDALIIRLHDPFFVCTLQTQPQPRAINGLLGAAVRNNHYFDRLRMNRERGRKLRQSLFE